MCYNWGISIKFKIMGEIESGRNTSAEAENLAEFCSGGLEFSDRQLLILKQTMVQYPEFLARVEKIRQVWERDQNEAVLMLENLRDDLSAILEGE